MRTEISYGVEFDCDLRDSLFNFFSLDTIVYSQKKNLLI